MKEDDLKSAVTDALEWNGWRWQHQRPAMKKDGSWMTPIEGHKGWPDIVAVKDGRMILAELKGSSGRCSPDQLVWLTMLAEVSGVETYLIGPSELADFLEVITGRSDGKEIRWVGRK
ncbi:MAG: hypothetical protein ABFR89_02410 [Actinomycetota bacterium]